MRLLEWTFCKVDSFSVHITECRAILGMCCTRSRLTFGISRSWPRYRVRHVGLILNNLSSCSRSYWLIKIGNIEWSFAFVASTSVMLPFVRRWSQSGCFFLVMLFSSCEYYHLMFLERLRFRIEIISLTYYRLPTIISSCWASSSRSASHLILEWFSKSFTLSQVCLTFLIIIKSNRWWHFRFRKFVYRLSFSHFFYCLRAQNSSFCLTYETREWTMSFLLTFFDRVLYSWLDSIIKSHLVTFIIGFFLWITILFLTGWLFKGHHRSLTCL